VPQGLTTTTVKHGLDPENLFARRFSFALVPLDGGAGREVYRAIDCTYARLSPDGARLAITCLVWKREGDTNVQVPELHVIAMKDGADKSFPMTGVLFRWFNDSERVLTIELKKRCTDEKGFERFFVGDLMILNVVSGKSTPLASVAINSEFHMDLSPDNRKALITALRTDRPGVDIEKQAQPKKETRDQAKLFVLDVEAGTIKATNRQANYAIFSPSGHQVLLGGPLERAFESGFKLHLFDGALTKSKPLADTLPRPSTMSFNGDGTLYPGWIDEKTIFYFDERSVYGTAGKSLSLMTIGTNGNGKRCVQPLIDLEAVRTEQ
jgi:hypothetical protein